MPEELKSAVTREVGHRLVQFSLVSMFVVTIAVAVVCSLTFSMHEAVGIMLLVLFSIVLTAMLITVIIWGRNYQRTFCIGAVVPLGVLLFKWPDVDRFLFGSGHRTFYPSARLVIVGFWASALLAGAICVGVRWMIDLRARPRGGPPHVDARKPADVANNPNDGVTPQPRNRHERHAP